MKRESVLKVAASAVFVALGAVSVAQAAPVLNVSGGGQAAAQMAEANFMAFLNPTTVVTEGFEGFTPAAGSQSTTINTSVGGFTQTLAGGIPSGACNDGGYSCGGGLAVLNDSTTPFSGRFATPSGPGNMNWLDSMDSQVMTFSLLSGGYTAVGFYVTDPNDVNGRLKVGVNSFYFEDIFGGAQGNGSVFYVSLYDESGLGDISFFANTNNDGYGIDNVTIGRVPEPGTLALMGLGLVVLGLARRRKKAV